MTMQDQALLESVSELVALAGYGINAALAELPSEANDDDLNAALETCQGSVETISMAADMAQLAGLQQLCGAVNETLGELNGHIHQFQTDLGPRLLDWSQAVQQYVRQPDARGITESLLVLAPSNQRSFLRLALGGAESEVTEAETTVAEMAEAEAAEAEVAEAAEAEAAEAEVELENSLISELEAAADEEPAVDALASVIEQASDSEIDAETDTAEAIESAFAAMMQTEDHQAEVPPAPLEAEQVGGADDDSPFSATEESSIEDTEVAEWAAAAPPDDVAEPTAPAMLDARAELTVEGETRAPALNEEAPTETAVEPDTTPKLVTESEGSTDSTQPAVAAAPTSVSETVGSAVFDDDTEWPNEAKSDDDEFEEAASAQLSEIFAELEPWRAILREPTASREELQVACAGYCRAIERVRAAGMALGLSGLGIVCELLENNIQALLDTAPTTRIEAVTQLANWPNITKMYLQAPEDESHQIALLDLLLHSSWPRQLTEDQTEELLAALGPDEDEYLADAEERPTVAQPDDVALAVDPDINPKLVEVFLHEAPVNAAGFTASLERVIRGEDTVKNLANAQRLAHNLKGSANLIGVKGVANLTHHIEDILEYLTEHQQAPQAALSNTLQEAADCIEVMLERLQGGADAPQDAQRILQDVLDWARRMDAGQLEIPVESVADKSLIVSALEPKPVVDSASRIAPAAPNLTAPEAVVAEAEAVAPEALAHESSLVRPQAAEPAATSGKVLRVSTNTIDALFRMVGEISIALDQMQETIQATRRRSNELHTQDTIVQQRRFELENFIDVRHLAGMQQRFSRLERRQDFDPLELDQYDELYSTTRSFIEAVMDSRRMAQNFRGELGRMEHIMAPLRRMKNDLQNAVMKVRMEPVDTISARLLRTVRQACRATGKQAELLIEGGATLLDSEVLDKLADPLMHMLRNAVDHGIETPDKRVGRGKSETGTIRLRFYHEGQNVVIECSDDGRGLDYESIRRTAIARGLQTSMANPQELARLILLPGFSTRSSATQLSGRGVGMDVVQNAIRELKGVMEIGDAVSGGCRIALRLPITLMTSHSLVVEVKGERYAIPTSTIMRVLSPRDGRFNQVGSKMAYEIGQDAYPAESLAVQLGLASSAADELRPDSAVLLVYSDTGPVAVAVDQLMSSQHLVLKSLGRYINSVRGIAGLSNLADGSLIPVLDLAELLRSPAQRAVATAVAIKVSDTPAPPSALTRVLIVDDSLSVRQSLSELMEEAGYQPILARDGVEAVDMLRRQPPDIVLSDIEMPRMNGLELVNYIRTTHSAELPILMITSRTMQKHRQQAEQAGANGYVTKPFNEDALLESIRSLLR